MLSTTLVTIPASQLTGSEYNTEDKKYSQLDLSHNRLFAAVNGDVKGATDMGFFDKLFDKVFNSSQKTEALKLLKNILEAELTELPTISQNNEYHDSLKHNFDALKALAGEHHQHLFVIKNEGSLDDISVEFIIGGKPIRSALNPDYVYDDRLDILNGFGSYSEDGDSLFLSRHGSHNFV
ncbi:hypothetical protein [uncultured Shewanella sp.]|uniref:hypothetical protein n=1 Tax=uncultured Shewanella sp. TaxID=173975 RepID=UPI002631FEE3|nr:hypothetical protein [uncultured Shewanella sp.]